MIPRGGHPLIASLLTEESHHVLASHTVVNEPTPNGTCRVIEILSYL
jgi:hypothetical protein